MVLSKSVHFIRFSSLTLQFVGNTEMMYFRESMTCWGWGWQLGGGLERVDAIQLMSKSQTNKPCFVFSYCVTVCCFSG